MRYTRAIQIAEKLYWVGAIDWNIRNFHGYATRYGTTYNAFLILDDKITLIDTVKYAFREEMLARISDVIDPRKIDYIISNHAELDHSGSLPYLIHLAQPEKIFASTMGAKALKEHNLTNHEITVVKDGSELSLGSVELTFYETRMLHWPDSMFTYMKNERILFSQDAFGMHFASSERFDSDHSFEVLRKEASKYFANILLPYAPMVSKLLERLDAKQVNPKMIAPDHGPIWKENPAKIIELYSQWAEQKAINKAVVVYATMWQSTEKMANAIVEGLVSNGTKAVLMSADTSDRSDIAAEIIDAGALIVGSSTLNNNLLPTIADILVYIKGLRRKGLIGAAFGSYGWGGESIKQIEAALAEMKIKTTFGSVKAKYVPKPEDLENCFKLGAEIAQELKRTTN